MRLARNRRLLGATDPELIERPRQMAPPSHGHCVIARISEPDAGALPTLGRAYCVHRAPASMRNQPHLMVRHYCLTDVRNGRYPSNIRTNCLSARACNSVERAWNSNGSIGTHHFSASMPIPRP